MVAGGYDYEKSGRNTSFLFQTSLEGIVHNLDTVIRVLLKSYTSQHAGSVLKTTYIFACLGVGP